MPSSKRSKLSKKNIQNQERKSNGYFLKRVLLCQECCVVPAAVVVVVAAAAAADVFEIFDDDDTDIIDDNDIWTEIVDSVELDELSNSNFDEEAIDARLHEVNLKWREANHNSNVRGAGSSESTYYRVEQSKQALAKNAKDFSTPLHHWMKPKEPEEVSDDMFIADAIENPAPKFAKQKKPNEQPKFTIITAMEYLVQHEAKISKNKQINKNMAKEINFWYYICSLSLYQYFAHIRYIVV
jgi:hypothetical protein